MKFGSLFSGCGGLDLGLINAGLIPAWANGNDPSACKVYRDNIGDIIEKNIEDISFDELEQVDLITAGFPCQPFSSAGNRKGVEDHRGNLFFETLRFIEYFKPKAILFENVRGLLSTKNKTGNKLINDIEDILTSINDTLGYKVKHRLLLSSDYEVPQNRYRVIIVGIRNDLEKDYHFPAPIIQDDVSALTVGSIIKNLNGAKNQVHWEFSPQAKHMIKFIPEGGSWKDIPYEELPPRFKRIKDEIKFYRSPNFYRRFGRNEICGTITASAQPENCGILHPLEDRRYTVREIARIQSFPDDFVFDLNQITEAYKVIGNAIPPRMAYHLGKSILNALE